MQPLKYLPPTKVLSYHPRLLPSQFQKKRDTNPKHNKEERSASEELKTAVKICKTLLILRAKKQLLHFSQSQRIQIPNLLVQNNSTDG